MNFLIILPLLLATAYAQANFGFNPTKLVDIHNNYRRQIKASNMKKMSWDDKLAKSAQNLANRCVFDHSDDNTRKQGNFGENLAASSDQPGKNINDLATQMWFNEGAKCGCGNKYQSCCGHYTQMVWADSNRIGCGYAHCPKGVAKASGSTHILVCQYSPPGNFLGQSAYKPGRACSQCQKCENGLCV